MYMYLRTFHPNANLTTKDKYDVQLLDAGVEEIDRIFQAFDNYYTYSSQEIEYRAFRGGYNSNSYAHGLLEAVGIPHEDLSDYIYYNWDNLVDAWYFQERSG